ncbi:MAG: hypothetical protein VX583_10505 [Bdellovibrionota bacterium]|nr:hypothetical protein [Pseudobdellovibrionaceae bacterium]|tara:strand:- start:17371 stop:17802 length:432 start_codon:yes stop_codon:yes gene_type:complete
MEMMKINWKKLVMIILCVQLSCLPGFAQQNQNGIEPSGTRKQIAGIVFSGLAGAVLGLSTLSFYGRPQDRLSNIAVGFALGIIAGSVFITYGATTNPDKFYGRELSAAYDNEKLLFSDLEMRAMQMQKTPKLELSVPLLNYQF